MSKASITSRVLSDQVTLLNPGTTLDNNNAHLMVQAISDAQAKGYRFVIIDMSGLEFLSSAGVGSILGTIEHSRSRGGDVILCQVPSNILHVLQVLDLTDFLSIAPDRTEALARAGMPG